MAAIAAPQAAALWAGLWGAPVWLLTLAAWALGVAGVAAAGGLRLYRLQALLANALIVVPADVVMAALYVVLTPIRYVFGQYEMSYFTNGLRKMAGRSDTVTMWTATWAAWLDSVPAAYSLMTVTKAAPDGIDCLTTPPEDFGAALDAVASDPSQPFVALRAKVESMLPAWVRTSTLFRLVASVVILPFLGWWLVGFAYIPLLHAPAAGTQDGLSVVTAIPTCHFLTRARKHHGDEKGTHACLNECQQGIEKIMGKGIIGTRMVVTPNLTTCSCRSVMDPVLEPPTCAKGLVDVEELA